tara:strand:- start:232 stop:489 length:258 start_codon:yes stop_codon:yes gene_type:complete
MEPEHHGKPASNHTASIETATKTPEKPRQIVLSASIGIGVAIFIMVPAVYRLATEPGRWADAIFVSVGVGLIIFHTARMIRLPGK